MKKHLLSTTIAASIFSLCILMTSCGSKHNEAKTSNDSTAQSGEMKMEVAEASFSCPMHPDITGKEGDSCSKCGMPLEGPKTDSTKEHHE